MALALFDLDNTLLAGDSDYLWGDFLVSQNVVDGAYFAAENRKFYQAYEAGTLDIYAYLAFQLGALTQYDRTTLNHWRSRFVTERIEPIVAPHSRALLQWHQQRGDTLVIITATNHFVTSPIAALLGVSHLLATELEVEKDRFTGRPVGIPCFREGKVQRLTQWMERHQMDLTESWFYSDSHNDLPLLNQVTHPVAVDPDETLSRIAQQSGWEIISLRQPGTPTRRI